ncbi:hypothetical protein GCM10023319_80900 [Nocardia iowensis]
MVPSGENTSRSSVGVADPVATESPAIINAPNVIADRRRNNGMAKLLEWFREFDPDGGDVACRTSMYRIHDK